VYIALLFLPGEAKRYLR